MAEQAPAPDDSQLGPRWLNELRPGGEGEGFLEKNLRHSLMFVRRPVSRLLVTFDNLSNVGDTSVEREPWAFKYAQDEQISHLGIMAHVSDWYRDPDLIARMKQLAKDGFFDRYDRVVFAGVSMGGYAAIAYGSLVPGAHVVSVNPQSTLNPDLVPWETRYENGQRQDWTLPLGDAAKLTKKLGRVNIFYDPYHELDQQHVDRFSGDNIRVFNCWFSNHKTAVFLRKIDALKPVMNHCIFDELTDLEFYRLYRARRYLPWYRGSLSAYFREMGRIELGERIDKAFRIRLRNKKRADAVAGEGADTPESNAEPVKQVEAGLAAQPEYIKNLKRPDEAGKQARIVPPENTGGKAPARIARKDMGSRIIVTTMKNEGPFMLEWVAYNRAIGFTDFLIYTNDCDDNTDKIADRLQELGLAQHRENKFKKGGSPQRTALRVSQSEPLVQNADWLICADCDEFLNVRVGKGRLDDLFAAVGDADAVSVCWKLFGNSGRMAYEEGFVTEQFDCCLGEDEYPNFRARGMKTLVRRSERLERLRIHRPAFRLDKGDVKWVDGGGRPMPDSYLEGGWKTHGAFTHDLVRLHHYAVRSVESFLVKRDRGRTNHVGDDQGENYWSTMNYNSTRDTSIHARLPLLRAEMARLLKDPELARLHEGACDWHRGKIKDLMKRDGWDEFRDRISKINAAPDVTEAQAEDVSA
ncbi:glycosyltransferase family 2 protein [uncultured Roseovarius sp.]|uniref:glycosyltransferase family 2 protein n=1 Tax=uncultured Roseovarius sp. TaxID=293344 RepID=UPI00261F7982|nr:glycosyltransferase family 2 protein [uncultured Roseovarius sp.]